MYHAYILVDPDVPTDVRYIGVTKNLSKRLTQHVYSAKTYPNGTKKENWIGKLLSQGRRPVMVPMDSTLTESEVFELEKDLIRTFSEAGHNLCNGTSGGPGFDSTWETKTGMTLEEMWKDPVWVEGRVQTFKEYWASAENRLAQSERVSLYFENEENRLAVSERLKKYYEENPAEKWSAEKKAEFKRSDGFLKMVEAKQGEEYKESMRANAEKQFSDPKARKESSSHAKRGWDSLTPEQRRDRIIKGRLGNNLSWAKKHGRVLNLTPKYCTCKDSK